MNFRAALLLPTVFTAIGAATAAAAPIQIVRAGPPDKAIATSVATEPGVRVVYVSGTAADPANPGAAAGSIERFGDTETQTRSILNKIEAALVEQGMTLSDIVQMNVFLVAPPAQPRMDFAGMMRAYQERFGTPGQPNKPARATLQVAGLVDPGWLAEIEVTAVKAGGQ
jgi:enamine deaminase RidA (YjgF/YER057c/UK114 family)